jgi:formylglycine-generating enzyme required for sulfatase activity
MARYEGADAGAMAIPGYEILEKIGQGGMGEVFLARQEALGRQVAVKFLAIDPAGDASEQLARFRREAELMARVSHPNVVSVLDFGVAPGWAYLVMEYIEGGDLRRRMTPGRPMTAAQVRSLIAPVARALAFLHRLGILHRDLKPENILLHHEDHPKVTDFGVAVLHSCLGSMTGADRYLGTIGYIAPEQQYQLKMDARADQYSLAALTYEMLCGRRPLGAFKPPSAYNPALGPAADAVLLRALQEDPEDRFASVLEFHDALDRALAAPPGRRWHRPVLRLAAAALLVAAVALGALKWRTSEGVASPPAGAVPPASAAATGPPRRLTVSHGLRLALIPAGEFVMGPHTSGADAHDDDGRPGRPVRIAAPFYLGVHEVTVGQFRAFVAATGYRTEAETDGLGGSIWDGRAKQVRHDPQCCWSNPGWAVAVTDEMPVVQVSWNDAQAFCRWLSGEEGHAYRLPTEAEWEYACRAGSTTPWCMGDDPAQLDQYAWFRENSRGDPHPVGLKRPNAFGLHDMHGNVWEWCLNAYRARSPGDDGDPAAASSRTTARILRGGAWDCSARRLRSTYRNSAPALFRFLVHGFRVCRPLPSNRASEAGSHG